MRECAFDTEGIRNSYLEDVHDFVGNHHDPHDRDEEPHGASCHLSSRVRAHVGKCDHKQRKHESPEGRPNQHPLYVIISTLTKSKKRSSQRGDDALNNTVTQNRGPKIHWTAVNHLLNATS